MINCVITDDEPIARQIIETYIGKLPNLHLVDSCSNALETLKVLNEKHIDLLFLDIQMPEISGLDFLKTLRNPPQVIFTTAFSEYALESYEYAVVDYLLKPISFERFLKAVNKVKVVEEAKEESLHKEYVWLKDGNELVRIYFDEVLYIEGLKDYVKIICQDKNIVTLSTMKNMEELLPDNFVRIHRSFIINVKKVNSFVGNSVRIGTQLISSGKSYRENFEKLKL